MNRCTYIKSNLIILLGDLNVNLLCSHSSDSRRLLSLLSNFQLVQLINEPTRITSSSESLLDVMCVSNCFCVNSYGTHDLLNNSDHLLTFCNINFPCYIKSTNYITCRNFKNFDIKSFIRDGENVNWHHINQCEDLNTRAEMLNDVILWLFDIHAPIIKFKPKKNYNPYITHNIKQMIRLKDQAHKTYLKHKTETSRNYYCDLRNYVKAAVTRERKAYVQFVLNSNKGNSTELWNHFQQLGVCTKRNSKSDIPTSLQNPQAMMNE